MRLAIFTLLTLSAFGATNRIVTVKSSGGDYASLAAAIAGEKGDLVSLDRQLTIECYAMTDTTAVTIADADWVTDATRYIFITVPSGERHDGLYNTAKYRLEVANGTSLTTTEAYVRLDGLQIYTTGNYTTSVFGAPASGSAEIRVSNTIFRGTSSMASKGIMASTSTNGSSSMFTFWNNLFYGASNDWGARITHTGNWYFYNNTFAGAYQAISRTNGTVVLVNNLFTGNTKTGGGATVLAAGTDYNRTSNSLLDYTVTGGGNAHDATSQTFAFVDAANKDWHLQEADTGAKDQGLSDPSSGLFSTDIDGVTRLGTWDVGADEYPSATRRRNAIVAWVPKN